MSPRPVSTRLNVILGVVGAVVGSLLVVCAALLVILAGVRFKGNGKGGLTGSNLKQEDLETGRKLGVPLVKSTPLGISYTERTLPSPVRSSVSPTGAVSTLLFNPNDRIPSQAKHLKLTTPLKKSIRVIHNHTSSLHTHSSSELSAPIRSKTCLKNLSRVITIAGKFEEVLTNQGNPPRSLGNPPNPSTAIGSDFRHPDDFPVDANLRCSENRFVKICNDDEIESESSESPPSIYDSQSIGEWPECGTTENDSRHFM